MLQSDPPRPHLLPFALVASLVLACAPPADGPDRTLGDDDDDVGTGSGVAPTIADVEIGASESNTLTAIVRWTTDLPGTSVVEFGPGGEFTSWIGDPNTLTTDHEVVVVGMHPESEYLLQPVSASASGAEARGGTYFFQTGGLPFPAFEPRLAVGNQDRMADGWTLANLVTRGIASPAFVVIFDQQGVPVWYWGEDINGGRADVDASFVDGERILIGAGVAPHGPMEIDLAGEIAWEGPPQDGTDLLADGDMHHVFEKLDNGNYVTLVYDYVGSLHDVIEEFDADGNVVWSWNALEHLDHGDGYLWGNAAEVDLDGDAVYYNSVKGSKLYKIRRSTGELLWTLGEGGDFVNEQREEDAWFIGAHGPEVQPNGNILMYDNGDHDRGFSRVIEYAIDEAEGEAFIAWEYPGAGIEDEWINGQWGDADRLANGNTLITAGSVLPASSECRLFEVTLGGEKVWELWLESSDPEQTFGAYAADRIPALAHSL